MKDEQSQREEKRSGDVAYHEEDVMATTKWKRHSQYRFMSKSVFRHSVTRW